MEWANKGGLAAYRTSIKEGLARGVALAGEHILETSNRTVPIEESTLQNSGDVTTDGFTATVSYDTEYAVYQHEDMAYRHDSGRSAKFLESAINSQARQSGEIIARTARGSL